MKSCMVGIGHFAFGSLIQTMLETRVIDVILLDTFLHSVVELSAGIQSNSHL